LVVAEAEPVGELIEEEVPGDLDQIFALRPEVLEMVEPMADDEEEEDDRTGKKKKKKKKKYVEMEYDPDKDVVVVKKKRKRGEDEWNDNWNL
jgi:N utilization substance protein A